MKRRKISALAIIGICLICLSLGLLLFTFVKTYVGNSQSRSVVNQIIESLPERTAGIPEVENGSNMPAREINGRDYVALIDIPAYDLTLPVADKWDSSKLHSSPIRFSGSAYDNTLVIGGSDNEGQLSFCDKIENNTEITVTDMTGAEYQYKVSRVDRSRSADADWLSSAEYDLTLFCKDTYSMEYIAVRCTYIYK